MDTHVCHASTCIAPGFLVAAYRRCRSFLRLPMNHVKGQTTLMNRSICCIAFRAQKFSGILFRVPQLRSWTENDGWIQAIFYIISCRTDEESPLLLVGCKVFRETLTYHTGERAFLTDAYARILPASWTGTPSSICTTAEYKEGCYVVDLGCSPNLKMLSSLAAEHLMFSGCQ